MVRSAKESKSLYLCPASAIIQEVFANNEKLSMTIRAAIIRMRQVTDWSAYEGHYGQLRAQRLLNELLEKL